MAFMIQITFVIYVIQPVLLVPIVEPTIVRHVMLIKIDKLMGQINVNVIMDITILLILETIVH